MLLFLLTVSVTLLGTIQAQKVGEDCDKYDILLRHHSVLDMASIYKSSNVVRYMY